MNEGFSAAQLDDFISRYSAEIARLARDVLAKMTRRFPGALQLVYDNYNALAIGFGPTERASEAIFSIVLYPRWVTLFFLQGAELPDPEKLLRGKGRQARHFVLSSPDDLDRPAIKQLMEFALAQAKVPLPRKPARQIIIKSISATQRPRRPRG
jgi:hypothetical protein